VLPLSAGTEKSVAATKSYIASLSALLQMTAAWSEDAELARALTLLPDQLNAAWKLDWTAAAPMLERAANLFVIARGVGLGIAQEAALKCKETCGLHAESFSSAEVRHGPQALLGTAFPALLFAQNDETREGMVTLARDLMERGVEVAIAGATVSGATVLPTIDSHPATAPVLIAQSFYRLANAVAIARGMDPDRPPNLQKVTRTH
jgi:glucosamine--fructose-6-phosphate aminotransferase (isomerizing)